MEGIQKNIDPVSQEFIDLATMLNEKWDIPFSKIADRVGIKDRKLVNIKRGQATADKAHVIALKSVYADLLGANTSLATLREEIHNGFERVLEKLGDIKAEPEK